MMGLGPAETCRGVRRNILKINCASSCFLFTRLYRDARSTKHKNILAIVKHMYFSLSSRRAEINFLSVSGSFYSPDLNLLRHLPSNILNSLQVFIVFLSFLRAVGACRLSSSFRDLSLFHFTGPQTKVTNILKPKTLFWPWCTRVTCVADDTHQTTKYWPPQFIPLNAKLNPICHLLGLLEARHILQFSRVRINENIWT